MSEGKIVRIFPRGSGQPSPGESQGTSRPAAPPKSNDAELLGRVARGDTGAHRTLFDRYYGRVLAFVRRRVRDEGLCEEIVSDVFFEIWRRADTFRGDSEVHSWIFGIAHFKALSARRFHGQLKRAKVVPMETEALHRMPDETDSAERIEKRQEVRRLLRALELLPEGQRDVLKLAFIEGLGYQEIGTRLGISEGNVKTRVNRARARLREMLQRPDGEGGAR